VQVFSPARPSAEFQNAKADARGFFSFVPDSSGSWRVVIDDEMGHRAELTVSVPDPFSSAAASSSSTPRWERAVTGLALLAAATGFLYGYRARRKPA
jgi:nickel transport protein